LDRELVESDIKAVGKYVRCHLFERTVFLFNKKLLDMGSKLHKDYLENCQPLIANGKLVALNDEEVMPYMNILWMLTNGEGWVLQHLVVKQKIKHVPGGAEFIH
jgi:hypothetical protein